MGPQEAVGCIICALNTTAVCHSSTKKVPNHRLHTARLHHLQTWGPSVLARHWGPLSARAWQPPAPCYLACSRGCISPALATHSTYVYQLLGQVKTLPQYMSMLKLHSGCTTWRSRQQMGRSCGCFRPSLIQSCIKARSSAPKYADGLGVVTEC